MRSLSILTAALLACGAASAQKPQCPPGTPQSAHCQNANAGKSTAKKAAPSRQQPDPLGMRVPGQSSLYDLNPGGGGLGASSMRPSGPGASSGGLRSPAGGMQPPRNY